MKVIEIFGDNKAEKYNRIIEGCRGIIIKDGKILLSYEKNIDQYLIPGGGLETGETLEECCRREIAEEAGISALPSVHYLRLDEYYNDIYFKSNYFICQILGECEKKLTSVEEENGLEPRWLDFQKAVEIFSDYESFKDTNKMRHGAYYREMLALLEYKKIQ